MRSLKAIAAALVAAISVTSAANATGYGYGSSSSSYTHTPAYTHSAPTSYGWTSPGYTHTNVTYHAQPSYGHGNAHGGHGPDYYRVSGVSSYDHLNVRYGPGVQHHVVDRLPYNAYNVQLVNCTQIQTRHGYSNWCLVNWNGYQRGWVNARYLREQ